jgi:hypothetical protein
MKTLTTLLATAALALAAGCAPTTATNDQASLGAVSGTSSCSAEKASCSSAQKASCSSAQKASCSSAQKAACCASKTAAAKTITCPLTGKQIDPADCPANTDKPSLGAVEGTKTKSGCCANKAKAAGCPFSKKSE